MKGITNWLQRIMAGRYGMDKLNNVLLWTGAIVVLVALFIPFFWVRIVLTMVSYALMFWAIGRTLSRNTYRRYRENRRFLMMIDRVRDRHHRYYNCPRCHQPVRVPRGKGKIAITCPKCKEKFVKKT